MKNLLISVLSILAFSGAQAQLADKMKADKEAILSMCGCYKVEFRYAEVYSPDTSYKFHEREYTSATEWVNPIEQTDKKIVLQHYLVVDTGTVKHWRQDWLFENTTAQLYNVNSNWIAAQFKAKDVKGQWTQKVFQVDDSPRYAATGTWNHVDGRHFWETTASSPLPRREHSTNKRTDYNVLVRNNRHEITNYGWLHYQNNEKVLRKDGKDKLIAVETGFNTYTKVPDSQCAVAKTAWEKDVKFWTMVRGAWDRKEAEGKDLTLKLMVNGEMLFEKMFELAAKSVSMATADVEREIQTIIKTHSVQPVAPTAGDTGMNKE